MRRLCWGKGLDVLNIRGRWRAQWGGDGQTGGFRRELSFAGGHLLPALQGASACSLLGTREAGVGGWGGGSCGKGRKARTHGHTNAAPFARGSPSALIPFLLTLPPAPPAPSNPFQLLLLLLQFLELTHGLEIAGSSALSISSKVIFCFCYFGELRPPPMPSVLSCKPGIGFAPWTSTSCRWIDAHWLALA